MELMDKLNPEVVKIFGGSMMPKEVAHMSMNLNEVRDELMKQGYNYDFTQDDNYLLALFSEM